MSGVFGMFTSAFIAVSTLIALAAVAYLFFVLHQKHRTKWSALVFGASIALLVLTTIESGYSMVSMAASALPWGRSIAHVPMELWWVFWWAARGIMLLGTISLIGFALEARRDRQVAESAKAG